MRLGSLAEKAKNLFQRRGGTEALKEDVDELRDIARGEGTATDKAKEAAEALKEPGAGERPPAPEAPSPREETGRAPERPLGAEPPPPREEPRDVGREPERGEPGGFGGERERGGPGGGSQGEGGGPEERA